MLDLQIMKSDTLRDMRNPQYFVPLAQAARETKIHRGTLYRWIKDGLLKRIDRPGNTFGFVSTVAVLELKDGGREKRSVARRVKKLRAAYPHPKGKLREHHPRVKFSEKEDAISLCMRFSREINRRWDLESYAPPVWEDVLAHLERQQDNLKRRMRERRLR